VGDGGDPFDLAAAPPPPCLRGPFVPRLRLCDSRASNSNDGLACLEYCICDARGAI
jgi:hypothetical protein